MNDKAEVRGYIAGHKAAQSEMFSEKDIHKAIDFTIENYKNNYLSEAKIKRFIQSLKLEKLKEKL